MDVQGTYRRWVSENKDVELPVELAAIADNPETNQFYMKLEFGTGCLCGVLGIGIYRMHVHTVIKIIQGYTNYLTRKDKICEVAAPDSKLYGSSMTLNLSWMKLKFKVCLTTIGLNSRVAKALSEELAHDLTFG